MRMLFDSFTFHSIWSKTLNCTALSILWVLTWKVLPIFFFIAIAYCALMRKSGFRISCFNNLKAKNSKVENILKGSLDLIQSPSPSVKIQIIGKNVCLRYKDKTLQGVVNKLLEIKSLLKSPSNVLPNYLQKPFPPIWIFTKGDGIKFRLSS